MGTQAVVAVIEAGYRLDVDDTGWLHGVTEAARPVLGAEDGAVALYFDTRRTPDRWVERGLPFDVDERLAALVPDFYAAVPIELRRRLLCGVPALSVSSRLLSKGAPLSEFALTAPLARRFGIGDALVLCVADVSGAGFVIGSIRRNRATISAATSARWQRIAAHLAAGLRLREELRNAEFDASLTPLHMAEAILDVDHRVVHAKPSAASSNLRERLRIAARARDRARTRASKEDDGLDSWHALVSGRWSLIDRFESDGRRYTIALENAPRITDPRALGARERCVVHLAARGHANKSIAYSLGMAEGTVGATLARALAKLKLTSRAELASWMGASEDRAGASRSVLHLGTRIVVSGSGVTWGGRCAGLTPQQRRIAEKVARGASNAQIAAALGCSPRTVANQLGRIFQRLKLRSRVELAHWIARTELGSPASSQPACK